MKNEFIKDQLWNVLEATQSINIYLQNNNQETLKKFEKILKKMF